LDRDRVISRNRAMLLRLVGVLSFMLGLEEGGADEVPRRVWRRIVRRPAESAARRLIVLAARGITLPPLSPLRRGPKDGSRPVARPHRHEGTEGGAWRRNRKTPLCRRKRRHLPRKGGEWLHKG